MSVLGIYAAKQGISAGFGAIGGLISGATSRRNLRKQQQYNLELLKMQNQYAMEQADAAYQREIDFYNRQNAYNDPSAVRDRYKAAGLNINSAFGIAGSYTPNQSSPSVPQADTIAPPYQNADIRFGDPLEAAYKMAMIRNIDAQTEKTKGDTLDSGETKRGQQLTNNLLEQKVIGQRVANDQAAFDLEFDRDTREDNLATIVAKRKNIQQQFNNLVAAYEKDLAGKKLSEEQAREVASRITLNAAQAAYYDAAEAAQRSNTSLDPVRKLLMQSSANLNDANALLADANTVLVEHKQDTEVSQKELNEASAALAKAKKAVAEVEEQLQHGELAMMPIRHLAGSLSTILPLVLQILKYVPK